jgi:putative ABC transport system substrate-binding protein
MLGIKRREFIALLGGTATWPITTRAQQRAGVPTIGWLGPGRPPEAAEWVSAFVRRLRELGWIEGRTVTIEYRWAEGRSERYAELATEFVRLKVDVIVTAAIQPTAAAKKVTTTVPIVGVAIGDPLGSGLVQSLARPGGNVTGLSLQNPELTGKRVELLREVVPSLHRLACLFDGTNPVNVAVAVEVQDASRKLGLEVDLMEVKRAEDIAPAFAKSAGRVQGVLVAGGPLAVTNRARIHTIAMSERLPVVYYSREYVEAGGLMSYGANLPDQYRRAAEFVDNILRGAKPADIPVEQPTKFDLIINLNTAKALGLTMPESFLLRADEIIE